MVARRWADDSEPNQPGIEAAQKILHLGWLTRSVNRVARRTPEFAAKFGNGLIICRKQYSAAHAWTKAIGGPRLLLFLLPIT